MLTVGVQFFYLIIRIDSNVYYQAANMWDSGSPVWNFQYQQ